MIALTMKNFVVSYIYSFSELDFRSSWYVKSHALSLWHTYCSNCTCNHGEWNTREVWRAFLNYCKYIFQTSCSKVFFWKHLFSILEMNNFKEYIPFDKMQRGVSRWCRLNWRFSLNLTKKKEIFFVL